MTAPADPADDAGDGGAGTAASDLFFGLSAILIVLICLLSQNLQHALAEQTRAATAETGRALIAAATQSGLRLAIARAGGVDLVSPGAAPLTLPTDALLGAALRDWAARPGNPTVIITADATDSAFLIDTALAQAGLTGYSRIRLAAPCLSPRFTPTGLSCNG